MGHRSIANTVVYTSVADKRIRNKRKKINRLAEKLVECAIEDKQGWGAANRSQRHR